jgi:hypothetical protein
MTREDYIKVCVDRAIDEANNILDNHLRPFDQVIENLIPNNMDEEEFNIFLEETREKIKNDTIT